MTNNTYETRRWKDGKLTFGFVQWHPIDTIPVEGRLLLYRDGKIFCGCVAFRKKKSTYCWVDGRSIPQVMDMWSYIPKELADLNPKPVDPSWNPPADLAKINFL